MEMTPVNKGADASAKTVPIAMPVERTPAKNAAAKRAMPSPAASHSQGATGLYSVRGCLLLMIAATTIRKAAPMMVRIVATPSGERLSGPSSCDVPVVAKHTAANTTSKRDLTPRR